MSFASCAKKVCPDKLSLFLRYYKNTGKILHFHNPKRFTEKLQLYKLEKNFPLMSKCHDKYTVHEYVKEKGFEHILVPLYQVAEKSEYLDFASLPDKFVMKTTNSPAIQISSAMISLLSTGTQPANNWMRGVMWML